MKLALAGDTMLGRKVGERLAAAPSAALFGDDVVAVAREADLFVLNLECSISERGERCQDRRKRFFFRAPPIAAEVLRHLGVGCVTLANNHALDYGPDALCDTFRHLADAGIAWVGAGVDECAARAPVVLERDGRRVGIVGVTDHPRDYAAAGDRPGVAFADLRRDVPRWLLDSIAATGAEIVVVSPHWGPNMVAEPVDHVLAAASALRAAGATLVAGHSAHVFHGVAERVLYDLGDFIDDYAIDPDLRNDLGLLFLVRFEKATPIEIEAVPLALDYCHTRLADHDQAAWIAHRFRKACAAFETDVVERDGRLVVALEPAGEPESRPGALAGRTRKEPIGHGRGSRSRSRGHRARPHTADVIVEAWGPDMASCCEEAVAALVDTYVASGEVAVVAERHARLPPASVEEMLLAVLDEVIFTLDTAAAVPVAIEVHPSGDGALEVVLALADPAGLESTGAVPKAVSRSGLEVEVSAGRVSCRFLVDL